jgi:hypothetical protein
LRRTILPETESLIAVDRHAKTVNVHNAQVCLGVQKPISFARAKRRKASLTLGSKRPGMPFFKGRQAYSWH